MRYELKKLAQACGLFLLIGGCNQPVSTDGNGILPNIRAQMSIMPLPAKITYKTGQLNLSKGINISNIPESEFASAAVNRFKQHLNYIDIPIGIEDGIAVRISIDSKTEPTLSLDTDESYSLSIQPDIISLSANNYVGLNHGLSTLIQLIFHARESQFIKCQEIRDEPRFAHRGLMIDVSRHWIPKETILKNLEYMSLAKMNVLHLHLSDDQAFRVESKLFPQLHLEGSNNNYYKQSDLHEIVAKARTLGIRVIPEFDMPGHCTSWLAAYPQLGMEKNDYELKKTYGIFSNV